MEAFYETQREKEILAQTLNQKTKDVDKIKAEIEEWEAKKKLTNSSLTKKQSEMSELEVQINRMDVKLDYDLNTLSETYELTFEKAKDKYPLTLEVEEAKNKVTIYKNTIKRIGMVNLEAIEEFERVNERYQFLNSQKEELLSAKDTLLEIIEEMDQVMKEEFKATFQLIEKEFVGTEHRLISNLSMSATERYLQLLKEKPEILQRVQLRHIASYLGISSEHLSRIRANTKNRMV